MTDTTDVPAGWKPVAELEDDLFQDTCDGSPNPEDDLCSAPAEFYRVCPCCSTHLTACRKHALLVPVFEAPEAASLDTESDIGKARMLAQIAPFMHLMSAREDAKAAALVAAQQQVLAEETFIREVSVLLRPMIEPQMPAIMDAIRATFGDSIKTLRKVKHEAVAMTDDAIMRAVEQFLISDKPLEALTAAIGKLMLAFSDVINEMTDENASTRHEREHPTILLQCEDGSYADDEHRAIISEEMENGDAAAGLVRANLRLRNCKRPAIAVRMEDKVTVFVAHPHPEDDA